MTIALTESLATKYRPTTLKHLAGQEAVRLQLQGMIKTKKFPPVFLITGNSGTGKTTIGRMINRYVNCAKLSACGECESCLKETHPDLMELNIADTRGIDDVRSIIQTSSMMPRYNKRIIFMDEVHMLTTQAANCLLKILEDPSKNTMFILATTNPEKVLAAIKGRCRKLELTPIKETDMVKRLMYIAKREGIDFTQIEDGKETVELLASLTNGQLRDAIQMLESLISAIQSGEKINPKTLMTKYIAAVSVDVEKQAARLLYALMNSNLKDILKNSLKSESARQLLSKLRWLVNYKLEAYVGKESYAPVSARYFYELEKKNPIKISYSNLLILQSVLTEAELTMNSASIDENIILSSAFGKFIRELQ